MAEASLRHVWAEIDLDAVRHNAGVMKRLIEPAALCAVVKADAYGHGAVAVARAAIEGGATWLGVAVVEEGIELRRAGIAAPVLVLSEPPPEAMIEAISNGLIPTVYTRAGITAAESAAASVASVAGPPSAGSVSAGSVSAGSASAGSASAGSASAGSASAGLASVAGPPSARSVSAASASRKVDVHLKVDTGMHRVGADPAATVALATAVCESPHLRLGAVWTHLAVAEGLGDEDRSFTSEQIRRYDEVLAQLASAGIAVPMRHAANSAAAIAHPASRYDMVRSGISIYGELPTAELAPFLDAAGERLVPVMSLKARVMLVRELPAGERPSYGRRRALGEDSVVAVIPLGYADGVPRAWFERDGTVLVGGQHRPLAGTVTMDQIVIDCGADSGVKVGDEVVLIGRQGDASLRASDWADVLGTISYEVLCGIGPRVTRVFVGQRDADPEESMSGSSDRDGSVARDGTPRDGTPRDGSAARDASPTSVAAGIPK